MQTTPAGVMQIVPGTVIYARPLDGLLDAEGYRTADDDIFLSACGDG